jgi:hypothetical protein
VAGFHGWIEFVSFQFSVFREEEEPDGTEKTDLLEFEEDEVSGDENDDGSDNAKT